MDIGSRLKAEIEGREWSTRRFQQEVERIAPDTRGTSYASVYEYVDGRTDPPLSFLTVAAKVLNVRPAYLAFGDEPKSPVEEAMKADGRSRFMEEVDGGPVRDAAGIVSSLTFGAGEDLLVRLVHQLVSAQPAGAPELSAEDLGHASQVIQSTIFGTLNAIRGAPGPQLVGPSVQFILGSLLAMLAAVPAPHAGRPLADVLELLPQSKEIIPAAARKAMDEKATNETKGAQ